LIKLELVDHSGQYGIPYRNQVQDEDEEECGSKGPEDQSKQNASQLIVSPEKRQYRTASADRGGIDTADSNRGLIAEQPSIVQSGSGI